MLPTGRKADIKAAKTHCDMSMSKVFSELIQCDQWLHTNIQWIMILTVEEWNKLHVQCT